MASSNENVSMALFCDFENVALGVRDANYDKFDIKPVLERLLLKGSIVVKKAYCDWDRYKSFKASMHEANFELIEIPHVRQSGKNSADIRMVVDALDLCYTKSHVDTFVIISGDSDFSPLVSKLRENAKKVIGVGVKQSTSDLLVANCDEFIFYDDLVRESRRARRETSNDKPQVKRTPEEERARRDEMEKRRNQAVEIAVNTFEALVLERGDSGKIWASVLKEAIKRRKPDFSESYYGFRTFGNLIEECKARGHLEFGRDEKSGAYVYRGSGVPQAASEAPAPADGAAPAASATPADGASQESRRSRNRGRTAAERFAERQAQRLTQHPRAAQGPVDGAPAQAAPVEAAPVETVAVVPEAAVELPVDAAASTPSRKKNGAKPPARKMKDAAKKGKQEAPAATAEPVVPAPAVKPIAPAPAPVEAVAVAVEAAPAADKPAKAAKGKSQDKPQAKPKAKPAADKPARKPAAPRAPRPPKAVAPAEE
ncbi:NYN domain-containing protein [Duganella sp. CY15W]|uniref:NYN domain-containing protein n=1 Tax=Duganella sp. CY15W TaxID=2692172 RepID=UPI00136FA237|nr:NYN domain-containing protein [Duganella sp. CY15W]MYM28792.1 NYN domain-containing protein [Duganella sp. CY15W]